jgi:aspartyl-tRNA(Asn)/glutamyl-tRNA(Gln) amidotransferase subunit B
LILKLKTDRSIESGGSLVQETRGWDENRGETVSQRKKESAHDYRYFPEPDIPPFDFTEEYFEALRRTLPELPDAKVKRFQEEYMLPEADALVLTEDREFSEYFEQVGSELAEKKASHEMTGWCQGIQARRELSHHGGAQTPRGSE